MTTDEKIDALLIEWGVPYSAKLVGETKRDEWVCDKWAVTLGSLSTDFFTGTGLRKKVKPSAASVLHSLLLDASANDRSFNDWCSDYDYSNDSMKAFETYQACCAIGEKLRKIFNHAQRETLRELLEGY